MTRNYKPLTIYQTRFTLFLNTALHENKQPNAHLFLNHGASYLKGFKEYIEVEVQVGNKAYFSYLMELPAYCGLKVAVCWVELGAWRAKLVVASRMEMAALWYIPAHKDLLDYTYLVYEKKLSEYEQIKEIN